MLSLIIGIVVGIIAGIIAALFLDGDERICSVVFGIMVFVFSWGIAEIVIAEFSPSVDTLPAEVCESKEIRDNRYYEASQSGDSVSVYVMKSDSTSKKETYAEELILFQKGEQAQIEN